MIHSGAVVGAGLPQVRMVERGGEALAVLSWAGAFCDAIWGKVHRDPPNMTLESDY